MKKLLFSCFLVAVCFLVNAQSVDSIPKEYHLNGSISATNNGISFIPTFSLGKPATIFNFSVGGKKLSFEPEMRFSLEGKPWSFLLWWRYKLVNDDKFKITLGAHPGFAFTAIESSLNGVNTSSIKVQRYLAGEFAPNYFVTKNLSIGMYYLYSHGVDFGTIGNTHFLTLNANINNINLSNGYYARIIPQVYFLKMDAKSGYYVTSSLTLFKKNCPFSVSAVGNKIINTQITASPNFVWNASLIYAFNNKFKKW